MYLFVTYAREEMKGVQSRGLKIAKYFLKKEVLFLNGGDSKWIKRQGYKYKNYNFNQFLLPSQINLPRNTKTIVFCDLPTNRAFQISLFIKAIKEKITTVVIENIYRKSQPKELVYKNLVNSCDKSIFTGLNFLKSKTKDGATIVPPFIDFPSESKEELQEKILKKFKVKTRPEKIILGIGYSPYIYQSIIKIANHFSSRNFLFIVISQTKSIRKRKNFIIIPPLQSKNLSRYLKASDLVICKAGYLQIIESLAIGIPTVAIGEPSIWVKKGKIVQGKGTSGFKQEWLDKKILEVVPISKTFSVNPYKKIEKLLLSKRYRSGIIKKIKSLHREKTNGAKITADLIRATKFHPKKFPKILILTLDKRQETEEAKKLLRKYPFALPIYISMPFFTNVFNRRLLEYDPTPKKDTLHYQSSLIYDFGFDSLHGFLKTISWLEPLFENLKYLLENTEKCIVVGKETYDYFKEILSKYKKKIEIVDKNFKYNIRGK